MIRIALITFISFSVFFISGCVEDDKPSKEADYDTTKKMVIDILQTDDGKKALKELMSDEEMKKQLVIESDLVKDSIDQVLISEQGKQMWSTLFQDPEFTQTFATSMSEEQKDLMKRLMNDASYQKQMLELLQDPEMMKQILTVMKSQEFRSHLEETIQQTLETPLFQTKIEDILLKAAEKQGEESKSEEKDASQLEETENEGDDSST